MKPIGLEPIQLISKTNALPIKLGFFNKPTLIYSYLFSSRTNFR
jgi:hypothetical protein